MAILELDYSGYPTEETLKAIETWSFTDGYDILMNQIASIVEPYGTLVKVEDNRWKLITGGWSGNETIVRSLQKNQLFWSMCWYMSKRGGYYEFIVRNIED